jgi:ABC-type branched-subunit amino acid transport system ATPase component
METKTYILPSNKNLKLEVNANGICYLIGGKGRSALVNCLSSFVTSYQLSIIRELGLPESLVK